MAHQSATNGTHSTDDLRTHEDLTRVSLAGGVVLYEESNNGLDREIVGFEDVTSLAALADGLGARNEDPMLAYQLPILS